MRGFALNSRLSSSRSNSSGGRCMVNQSAASSSTDCALATDLAAKVKSVMAAAPSAPHNKCLRASAHRAPFLSPAPFMAQPQLQTCNAYSSNIPNTSPPTPLPTLLCSPFPVLPVIPIPVLPVIPSAAEESKATAGTKPIAQHRTALEQTAHPCYAPFRRGTDTAYRRS